MNQSSRAAGMRLEFGLKHFVRASERYTARLLCCLPIYLAVILASGCSLLPDIRHKPQYNNPFPQLRTIAILPFVNQSEEPTLSAERVTLAYINELQSIPGFEVLPLGVVRNRLREYDRPLNCGEDFQALARELGVDAVLLGSVIDYQPYYPPRMSIKVNWYAANPGFHPILPGYGLPWGTKQEKKIPKWIRREAERELATEQLRTQTPALQALNSTPPTTGAPETLVPPPRLMPEDLPEGELIRPTSVAEAIAAEQDAAVAIGSGVSGATMGEGSEGLPNDWPDARGFVPNAPSIERPALRPQHEPIISHMRNYNGHDEDFTRRVQDYCYFRDDARFGGWQAYLQRSEDFIRVCCHFHVTETLASRGGEEDSRLILRWPLERYQR